MGRTGCKRHPIHVNYLKSKNNSVEIMEFSVETRHQEKLVIYSYYKFMGHLLIIRCVSFETGISLSVFLVSPLYYSLSISGYLGEWKGILNNIK